MSGAFPFIFQVPPQNNPWSGFWKEFFLGILTAIVLAVLSWFVIRLKRGARNLLKARGRYRITGIWIAKCRLPRHPPEVEAVEIYRLVTRKEHVDIRFFHYLPHVDDVRRYEAVGIYRGMVLSAFYYIPEPQSYESGVFVLRNIGEKFKGVYAQYDVSADMALYVSEKDFVLRRLHIRLVEQMKMIFGFPPFHSYSQAKKLYDAIVSEELQPGAPLPKDV